MLTLNLFYTLIRMKVQSGQSHVLNMIIVLPGISLTALAKLADIAWQTLLFISKSLARDKKVTTDLRRKQ